MDGIRKFSNLRDLFRFFPARWRFCRRRRRRRRRRRGTEGSEFTHCCWFSVITILKICESFPIFSISFPVFEAFRKFRNDFFRFFKLFFWVNQGRDFKLNWQQSEGISRSSVLTLLMIFREEKVILKVQQLRLQRPIHTNDLTSCAIFFRFQSSKTQLCCRNWCFLQKKIVALAIERINGS